MVTRAVGRTLTAVFLVAFLACGFLDVEAWPLTAWRLFSHVRQSTQPGWEATVVDGTGTEREIPFADLPRGYRGSLHVLQRFPSFSPDRRQAVCDAYAGALRDRGEVVSAIRVYRVVTDVASDRPLERTLRFEC